MPDIVLTTLNAKYIHAAFGLRCLFANLGALRPDACIVEFDIHQRPVDIAEDLLARNPKIIGFGVYIWNVAAITEVVAAVKRVRPEVRVILGGPEVSHEVEGQPVAQLADHVITGEADLAFAEACRVLLEPRRPEPPSGKSGEGPVNPPVRLPKIIPAELPELARLNPPYELYTDDDVAHRIIYVEASRGCPFTCEFCLSSLDIPVRQFPLDTLLKQLERLLDRGVKQFKFVDRTFNLNIQTSRTLLQFFLDHYQQGHFFHFEMVPDRLPEALRGVIAEFPPGALQFEIGIQTFNEDVGRRIQRRQDYVRMAENLDFLRNRTGVHIHADLIAGLPGESLESFADGFDRLMSLGPHEIQVGILKRLRGTPIGRHDAEWGMVYNPHPPYEILQTRQIDFATMQRMRRFSRYWDLVGNSGNFIDSTPLIWSRGASPFRGFMRWSDWLHARLGRTDGIALVRLMELLFDFLVNERKLGAPATAGAIWNDYRRGGRRDKPSFLKDFLPADPPSPASRDDGCGLPKRQARHRARGTAPRRTLESPAESSKLSP